MKALLRGTNSDYELLAGKTITSHGILNNFPEGGIKLYIMLKTWQAQAGLKRLRLEPKKTFTPFIYIPHLLVGSSCFCIHVQIPLLLSSHRLSSWPSSIFLFFYLLQITCYHNIYLTLPYPTTQPPTTFHPTTCQSFTPSSSINSLHLSRAPHKRYKLFETPNKYSHPRILISFYHKSSKESVQGVHEQVCQLPTMHWQFMRIWNRSVGSCPFLGILGEQVANIFAGNGSFGKVYVMKRKTDGKVRIHPFHLPVSENTANCLSS